MPTYRLGSNPHVFAPGLVRWAINGYAFANDRANLLRIVTDSWPGLEAGHAHRLLSRDVTHYVEGETVVFTVDDGLPSPAGQEVVP